MSFDLAKRSERYRRFMSQNRIRTERSLIVPMQFSESQNYMWRFVAPDLDHQNADGEYDGQMWYIVLKGRQVYATTLFENLMFTRTLESSNVQSLVIAQDLDSSTDIFNMVKRFYDYLAIPKTRPSKTRELIIPLKGGTSRFKVVSAGTMSKGRGTTQTCLHCSEVAFWPHAEAMTGLSQAVPDVPNTIWVVESTANGMGGHGEMFYKMWKQAVGRRSKLTPIFVPWYLMQKYRADPEVRPEEYDDEESAIIEQFGKMGLDGRALRWRRNQIATKLESNVELFHQEYPCTPQEAFISSGLPAFDALAVMYQEQYIEKPLLRGTMQGGKFVKDTRGEIFLWDTPRDGRQYAIGVDTSEGLRGGDYACAQILRMDNMEQVGVVHGIIQPYEFSRTIHELGRWFNQAIVCVEVNNSGNTVQDYLLRKWMYPRLHPWRGKPTHIQETRLWGWSTNTYSRPLLIEAGRRAINTRLATIHDRATLMEIQAFTRQDDGKYEARADHDDRVLALLLALRSREENYSGAARIIEVPMSAPDTRGVRIVDSFDLQHLTPAHMRRIRYSTAVAKKRAEKAAKSWMQL